MALEKGLAQSEKAYSQFTEISSLFAKIVSEEFFYTWQWWLGVAYLLFHGLSGFLSGRRIVLDVFY
jgi:hypothetical protein